MNELHGMNEMNGVHGWGRGWETKAGVREANGFQRDYICQRIPFALSSLHGIRRGNNYDDLAFVLYNGMSANASI